MQASNLGHSTQKGQAVVAVGQVQVTGMVSRRGNRRQVVHQPAWPVPAAHLGKGVVQHDEATYLQYRLDGLEVGQHALRGVITIEEGGLDATGGAQEQCPHPTLCPSSGSTGATSPAAL